MNMTNLKQYIEVATPHYSNPKLVRKEAWCTVIMALFFTFGHGFIIKGNAIPFGITNLLCALTFTIITCRISRKESSVFNKCLLQALLATSWYLQLILTQLFHYYFTYGMDIFIIFIILFPLIIPVMLGRKNSIALHSKEGLPVPKTKFYIPVVFGLSGMIGTGLAKMFFSKVSQNTAFIFVIFSLTFLTCCTSLGFLSYQKIYYILKYHPYDL